MRKAICSGPNRSGICVCGHGWQEHHLGIKVSVIGYALIYVDGNPVQSCVCSARDGRGGLTAEVAE